MNEDVLSNVVPPCYVVDAIKLHARYGDLRAAFTRCFADFVIGLSYKTATLPWVLSSLQARGAWAEVVSEMEYELAIRLGSPPGQTIVNGPGKTFEFVSRVLARGDLLHIDSLDEISHVERWSRDHVGDGIRRVGLRVNVAVPDRGDGSERSRFGLSVTDGQVQEAAKRLAVLPSIRLAGLHAHVTTRTRRLSHFRAVVRDLVAAAEMVNPMQLEYIDLGGGFGYAPAGIPVAMPTFQEYAAAISDEFERTKPGLRALKIIIEPGLALFNDSVSIVAAVRARKSIGGAQLVVVDASVHTIKPTRHSVNLPTAAFDAAGRPKQGPTHQYDVVGYTCLEDDVIARGLQLPSLEVGDLLVIDGVGAYTYVLKPPFIQPRPAFYMWDGTGTHLIRKAECIADIFGAFGE